MLYAYSAGFCQKPECNRNIFIEVSSGKYASVGEMAHIVAAAASGPRSDPTTGDQRLTSLDNLILLCPICHLIVDKCPEKFPVEVIMGWKQRHDSRRRMLFAVGTHDSRAALRNELEGYLDHNRVIHHMYGPESEAAEDPMSDAVDMWRSEIQKSLIPNNRKILELLDSHRHLLTDEEKSVVAEFRVHVDAFEARHVFGEISASMPRFPTAMSVVAKDSQHA
jgi:hypothetical protein